MSWVIAALSFISLYLLTRKSKWGQAIGAVKEATFLLYALATHQYGFVVSTTSFTVMFLRGFIIWHRQEKQVLESSR